MRDLALFLSVSVLAPLSRRLASSGRQGPQGAVRPQWESQQAPSSTSQGPQGERLMGPAWILACACAQLAVARRERSLTALAEGTQAACGQGAGLVATETDEAQLGRQTAATGHPEL